MHVVKGMSGVALQHICTYEQIDIFAVAAARYDERSGRLDSQRRPAQRETGPAGAAIPTSSQRAMAIESGAQACSLASPSFSRQAP